MKRDITILGAGLVGSLLAIMFRNRGHKVDIYERRPDMRNQAAQEGRSINLTISARGWKALEMAGLKGDIDAISIPMYGRCMHQADGQVDFQPYSSAHDAIFSVNRGELNKKLVTLAERTGAAIHFGQRCTKVDVPANEIHFESDGNAKHTVAADLLFGADGAFSALRNSYSLLDNVASSHSYLEYGYKELCIPAGENGAWQMEKNALHIWPRQNSMLIAMPNISGSFTCTLFMPLEGEQSFAALTTEALIAEYFETKFADAKAMMPNLVADFISHPVGKLVTTHISKWHHEGRSALIGDAAHAIVPFYGQGMNAGFEDCTILSDLIEKFGDDWQAILSEYERMRKPNGEAVAKLALHNFAEIRDKVADPVFLVRKKIEKELSVRFPRQFSSVYEMVSFSDTPYDIAMKCIQAQDNLLQWIMSEGDFFENIKNDTFLKRLKVMVMEYNNRLQCYRLAAA